MSLPRDWQTIRRRALDVFDERIKVRRDLWCDVKGGAETGATWHRCLESFKNILLKPRNITSVDEVSTEVDVLGKRLNHPIMLAPMSQVITKIEDDAFMHAAKAFTESGSLAWIGYPMKDKVLEVTKHFPIVWIIKPLRDKEKLASEVRRAEELNCFAVGVDVDSIAGLKLDDEILYREMCAPISLDDLRSLRKETSLPFIVKGVISVEDAVDAVEIGADAIVVSNHCGVSMDYTKASIESVSEIKEAVNKKVEVYLDSGIRRGTDVLKALALGARAVLIGRVALWGLALGGDEGVKHVLEILLEELRRAMILTGVSRADRVSPDIII